MKKLSDFTDQEAEDLLFKALSDPELIREFLEKNKNEYESYTDKYGYECPHYFLETQYLELESFAYEYYKLSDL